MTKKIVFKTTGEKEFTFSVPEPANVNSFFVFSLPKAGSTLLMKIMADVCNVLGIPGVDLPTRLFNLDIRPAELTNDINRLWQNQGYAYVGFRLFFPQMAFDFSKTKNILLVRDPRDMLVSHYFSMRYSHVVPKLVEGDHSLAKQRAALQKTTVDQASLNTAKAYRNYFQEYMEHLPADTTRVYRYEDIIFKKKEWIEDMLDFLGFEVGAQKIKAIAEKHDVMPDTEDPTKHIRQVTPGNYKSHLAQTTIDKLDEIFDPVMRFFHYDSVISMKMGEQLSQSSNIQGSRKAPDVMDGHAGQLEQNLKTMRQLLSWRIAGFFRRFAFSQRLTACLDFFAKKFS